GTARLSNFSQSKRLPSMIECPSSDFKLEPHRVLGRAAPCLTICTFPATPAIALRIARIAAFATRALLGTLLIGMMLLNVANAVCRYLFGVVLIAADELLVFAMIWMVMIGMILLTIDRHHIALDFLANRLAPRPHIALTMFHHLLIAIGASLAAANPLMSGTVSRSHTIMAGFLPSTPCRKSAPAGTSPARARLPATAE